MSENNVQRREVVKSPEDLTVIRRLLPKGEKAFEIQFTDPNTDNSVRIKINSRLASMLIEYGINHAS